MRDYRTMLGQPTAIEALIAVLDRFDTYQALLYSFIRLCLTICHVGNTTTIISIHGE